MDQFVFMKSIAVTAVTAVSMKKDQKKWRVYF
jgi:hypothetical protein